MFNSVHKYTQSLDTWTDVLRCSCVAVFLSETAGTVGLSGGVPLLGNGISM